jgi:hypothetical protein
MAPKIMKKRVVSERKALQSIGCALVHAESADLKYIMKKLDEMPQAVTVLAGLLRDGTFQKSIEAKQNETGATSMLPGKYKKFKQLGVRFILEMIGDWEEGLEPGERLPPKVKKSQKEGLDEIMKLLAFALHMKVDAKLPSHDGSLVKSMCFQRYEAFKNRLQPGGGSIDFTFADMGHYKWDPVDLKVVVASWAIDDQKPMLDLAMPSDFLKTIGDFKVENNHSLDALLKSDSKDLVFPLLKIFEKQFPDKFASFKEVDVFPDSIFEEEEEEEAKEEAALAEPVKKIPDASPAGTPAKRPLAIEAAGALATPAKKSRGSPPSGNGGAGEAATPQA